LPLHIIRLSYAENFLSLLCPALNAPFGSFKHLLLRTPTPNPPFDFHFIPFQPLPPPSTLLYSTSPLNFHLSETSIKPQPDLEEFGLNLALIHYTTTGRLPPSKVGINISSQHEVD
jgi:hypothetical protein